MPQTPIRPTAPAALRAAVRPILRAVIERPGSLYQPLFLGPVASVDLIEADIHGLADAAGLPVYCGFSAPAERTLAGGSPAVLVFDADMLSAYVAAGHRPGAAQQLIIWAPVPVDELPLAARDRVATGLALDATDLVRPESGEWSMGPTLARRARDPGGAYNPVILIAPPERLAFVADEAALRRESAGVHPVLRLSHTARSDEPAVARLGAGSAVVLRAPDSAAARVERTIAALRDRDVQVVLAIDERALHAIESDVAWRDALDRAVTLVVAAGEEPTTMRTSAAVPARPLGEVLLGAPDLGPEPERLMTGSLSSFPLPDLLQTFGGGRHTGRLVVFSTEQVGAIDIDGGRVVHAQHVGDPRTLVDIARARGVEPDEDLAAALAQQRTADIGRWSDRSFTFGASAVPEPPAGERVSLPVDRLAIETARRRHRAFGAPVRPTDTPRYRVAVAFQHETCTFCPGGDISADDWRERLAGDQVLTSGSYVGGFVRQAEDYGDMELVGLRSPANVFGGSSRSWNTREAFDGFVEAMLEDLRAAMPVDGVYLALRGAVAVRDVPRPEAEIARRFREVVGPDVPIAGTFDLHGNEDEAFPRYADFAFVTKRYPHYDAAIQGGRAARAMHRVMNGTYTPTTATRKPGVITATVLQWTGQSPSMDIMERARRGEGREDDPFVSVFYGYPWSDVPDVGATVHVMTNGDEQLADRIADDMNDFIRRVREAFAVGGYPLPAEAARQVADAIRAGATPIAVGDHSERPGDATHTFKAFEAAGIDRILHGAITDPAVPERLAESGADAGDAFDQEVGGFTPSGGTPVRVRGELVYFGAWRGYDQVVVEAPEPFVGTTHLDALPYENVDLTTLYPYGSPPGR